MTPAFDLGIGLAAEYEETVHEEMLRDARRDGLEHGYAAAARLARVRSEELAGAGRIDAAAAVYGLAREILDACKVEGDARFVRESDIRELRSGR